MTHIFYLLLCVMGVISAPVDDPVRIDLPVYDQPESASSTTVTEVPEPENYPGSENKQPQSKQKPVQPVSIVLDSKTNSNTLIGSVNYGGGLFKPPVTRLDGALLETEGIGSKILSVKENAQNVVAGIFQPQPLVDTIKEEEKYGNTGDKFQSTGRALVNGAEGISNFVNSILEVPGKIFRSITRAASEKLNNLGGKLVGL
ncbi:uncharacterized protein LOC120636596 [Pararge aegeria]|uniref:uncharacterized protein LOC120636596 n=1 Tax=Pararge aegeria TaxID=116150 RepID=UPI0019D1EBFF|nr:uncharacterized protein LOC120636596 [Pararge aegeria]